MVLRLLLILLFPSFVWAGANYYLGGTTVLPQELGVSVINGSLHILADLSSGVTVINGVMYVN